MKKFSNKTLALLVSVALLLTFAVSGTVAYLTANTGSLVNTFTPGTVVPDIEETRGETVKSNVYIKNTGTADAYVRAMVVVTWQNDAGEVYPKMPEAGTDYTIEFGDNWTPVGNYWYYNGIVKGVVNDTVDQTTPLIVTCSSVVDNEPEGYNLHVEVLAQAVQATEEAAQNAWGYVPTTSAQ